MARYERRKVASERMKAAFAVYRQEQGDAAKASPPGNQSVPPMSSTMLQMERNLLDRINAAAKADGMECSAWIRDACIQRLGCQGR
ncbi:hypothetical protein [Roseomonas sp. KE2513]|uniref:hypothetical protein n=1 Tax=Roseomonas sp. KE2513 TaxID=2479202 RepID=UPI0018E008BC|nr:hypothetical protein [Roseomonas sp. KE2513]